MTFEVAKLYFLTGHVYIHAFILAFNWTRDAAHVGAQCNVQVNLESVVCSGALSSVHGQTGSCKLRLSCVINPAHVPRTALSCSVLTCERFPLVFRVNPNFFLTPCMSLEIRQKKTCGLRVYGNQNDHGEGVKAAGEFAHGRSPKEFLVLLEYLSNDTNHTVL